MEPDAISRDAVPAPADWTTWVESDGEVVVFDERRGRWGGAFQVNEIISPGT